MSGSRRIATLLLAVPFAIWVPTVSAAPQPGADPSLRAVAITASEVVLEWEGAPSGTVSYAISRDGAALATADASASSFVDTGVAGGRRYSYVVEAAGPGWTVASNVARVKTPGPHAADRYPPTEPEDVHAVAQADGSILIDWQGSNDETDISAYIIRRGNAHVAVVDAGTLRYVHRGNGGAGTYTVTAVDVAGRRSAPSDEATVEIQTTAGAGRAAAIDGATSAASGAYLPSLRRYPYLTDVVNAANGTVGYATINWATDRSATAGAAVWGSVAGDGSCTPTTTVAGARTPIQVNAVSLYQWEANLTLLPDQAYCYRVTLGGTDLLGGDPSPRFRTLLPTGSTTSFSFAVLGDWGQVDSTSSNPDQANLMQLMASSGVSFAVTTGDNAYQSGSQGNYGDLVEVGPELSAIFGPQYWTVAGSSIPMFPSIGNHGFLRNDAAHPHLLNWPQDRAVSELNGRYQRDTYCCLLGTPSLVLPSTWYAFDAGRARIYVLQAAWSDSNGGVNDDPYEVDAAYQWQPSSAQYQWLEQDLAAHPNQIKMAAFHYPLYSDQKHETSDQFLHAPGSLQGLLDDYGVKFAFNGHAHIYQRNLADAGGMVAYLTGGGGAKTQSVAEDPCLAIDAYAIGWSNSSSTGNACGAATPPSSPSEVIHFLKVTVANDQVTVEPINSLGQSFDVQTYEVGGPPGDTEAPSVPTGVDAVATSSTHVDVTWAASTDNVGVTGYDVLRDGAVIASLPGTALSYPDATVVASTTYSYQVVAKDLAGNQSAPSSAAVVTTPAPPDTEAPSVPTGVDAVATSSTHVDVTWAASTDNVGVTGYDVLRDGAVIASLPGTALSYPDATVVASTTYSYQVVAKDLAGNQSVPSSAAVVTTPAPSGPTTLTFVAVEDSYTDATNPNANFGTATNVFSDTSPAQRGYLKFTVSGVTGTVQSAVVRLWVTDSTSNAPQLATSSSAWTEAGLTWNNQPAPGAVTGDLGSAAKNTAIEYPVTAVVNGDGTYSFVLVAQSSNGLGVASRQATATNRPQLVITFVPSSSGDTEAPSVPTGVDAVATSSTHVDVTWAASTDNVGVTGYDVLRDGAVIASLPGTALSYPDATVVASTTYSYQVVAKDLAGNQSVPSSAAVVTTPAPSGPTTLTFVAVEDSYTDATNPNANFGTATNVFSDTSPAQRGYLKFTVSGVTGTVQSAVVRLWVTDSTSNAPQLATSSSAWTEAGLTWNNQPAPGAVTGDLGSAAKNTAIEYPVTAVVNGDGTYSFVLVAQSSNGLGVASRQATATNRPQLVITFD